MPCRRTKWKLQASYRCDHATMRPPCKCLSAAEAQGQLTVAHELQVSHAWDSMGAGQVVYAWVHRMGQWLHLAVHLMHMMWRHGSHDTMVSSSKLSKHTGQAALSATLL